MSERCELQRRLEKGDCQRDIVLFSFVLVGISRTGTDADGLKRPALDAAVKRAVAAEAGSGVSPDCISLAAFASEPVFVREAKQFGRGADESDRGSENDGLLKVSQSVEAGAWPQSIGDEGSPSTAARSTVLIRCMLAPAGSVRTGEVASLLRKKLGLPLAGPGTASSGPLVDRIAKELAVAKDLEVLAGHAVKVTDVSSPEVRSASLPDLRLDKRHGIPTKVFRLFDDLKVLEDSWVIAGINDHRTTGPLDAEEIVWSLQKVADVCKDPQLEKLFMLTIANLLQKDRRSCHRWAATIAPSNLRQLLCDNPVRRQICAKACGVYEQQSQLQMYAAECKLCVALALAAADSMKRWSEEMEPEDKAWLADAAGKLASVPDMQPSQARSLWDRSACRFLVIDLVCRNSGSMDAAIAQLRRCPKDIICSRFKALWRDGSNKEGSFLYLFPHFVRKNECAASDAFVAILAASFASTEGSDLFGAVRAFLEDAEVPAIVRRDFLVSFVSVCRLPRQPMATRPRAKRWSFFKVADHNVEADEEFAVPSLVGIDILVFEVILRDFATRSADHLSGGSADSGAYRDLAELFEVLLLVTSGDVLWDWVQDKLTTDITIVEVARRFIYLVAWRHLSDALRSFAGSVRPAWYAEDLARGLVESSRLWSYDLVKVGKRFPDVAQQPTRRQVEDACQLLLMYFRLDFALGAGSTWRLMQTLEEGSGGLAVRLARLAPAGSSLRRALAEDVRRCYGWTALQTPEVESLLQYLGFYDPSFQKCLGNFITEMVVADKAAELTRIPAAPGMLASLLEAVAKLLGSPGGSGGLSGEQALLDIASSCCSHRVSQRLLRHVTEAVRSSHSVGCEFTLAHLLDCARELGKAGMLLAFKLERKGAPLSLLKSTEQAVQTLLRQHASGEWAAVFRTLDTVIFALEYMGKEDLQLAYDQFEAECASMQHDLLIELLACVKKIYRSPLAGDRPEIVPPNADISELIRRASPPLAKRVLWGNVGFEPADWQRVVEIAGAAAECMRRRYSVLMLPHHTQMITLLMFAIRACGARSMGVGGVRLPKTMLARVGTGEGKSLIIAMIASFVSKRGLRAHVINDNRVLSRRDFETNQALFAALGLSASTDRNDLKNKACQIVYCTGDDVEHSCLDELVEGNVEEYEEGLKEAVLIVDEVDGLIFDKGVVTPQSFEDSEFSDWVATWLGQLEMRGEIERDWDDFRQQGECTMRIQSEVTEAWQELARKREGVDYVIRGGTPYMLDPKTNLVREDTWGLWMEVLKRQRSDGAYPVKYKHTKAILCRLQCFMSYACIFGLTGSLGRKSEKEYLCEHYEAATFNVPFFLDTCRDERRESETELRRPLDIGDRIIVQSDYDHKDDCAIEFDCVKTRGLVGTIARRKCSQPEEFLVELSDCRTMWFKEACLERGRFQGKNRPMLVGESDMFADQNAQDIAIVDLAVAKCADVPVLILVKDPEAVARVATALRHRLGDDCGGEQRAVIELVHDPARPQEFLDLVQLATEPLAAMEADISHSGATGYVTGEMVEVGPWHGDGGSSGEANHYGEAATWRQAWRITVSTAEGGRGHDYRVIDPAIDDRGGLLLILTWVPWSEREWIQFLGRTARQDHVGQYAVLLNAEDEQVIAGTHDRQEGESSAMAILRHGEAQTCDLLRGKGSEVTKGRLMHKLTSRFWALHKVRKTTKRQDWDWKRLCENYLDFTADAIQHLFSSSVIPPKELVLGFAKMDKTALVRPGLTEKTCRSCSTVNIFPKPVAGHEMPTVRCGNCGATE